MITHQVSLSQAEYSALLSTAFPDIGESAIGIQDVLRRLERLTQLEEAVRKALPRGHIHSVEVIECLTSNIAQTGELLRRPGA